MTDKGQPADDSQTPELTFEQQIELTDILEDYRSNPSNSNRYRYDLFVKIQEFMAAWADTRAREARIANARDFWLFVHDIVRDKEQRVFDHQEVIDIGSEAYKLHTGESIQKWFEEPELRTPEQEGTAS